MTTPSLTLLFVLSSFAVYRLSMLIAVEKGPARLLSKFRKLPPAKSSAREGLSCPHCVGLWIALALALPFTIAVESSTLPAQPWKPWLRLAVWAFSTLAIAGASSFMVRVGRASE